MTQLEKIQSIFRTSKEVLTENLEISKKKVYAFNEDIRLSLIAQLETHSHFKEDVLTSVYARDGMKGILKLVSAVSRNYSGMNNSTSTIANFKDQEAVKHLLYLIEKLIEIL